MKHIAITKQLLNGVELNSVSGRDLHKSLEIKKAFTTWMTSSLDAMGSIEGEDFLKLKTSLEGSGYQWDYILTLDLGKHIAMMSKAEKGKEIREYFIKVEKQHNSNLLSSLTEQMNKSQALFHTQEIMGEVISEHDKRIANLEKNQKIEHWQQKSLTDAKNEIVYKLGKDDEKLIRKLHSRVWSKFKSRFSIPRYCELPAYKYEDGLSYIYGLTLSDMM